MSFKNLVGRALRRLGYQLYRLEDVRPFARNLRSCLGSPVIRDLGLSTIIDVGASDGRWSREVRPLFPRSRFLLIEANPVHESALQALCREDQGFRYELKAASDRSGDIHFDASDPFGGIAAKSETTHTKKIPATSLDDACAAHQLTGPYLLKLDTHGFEVPIFEGAGAVLSQARALVVEVYNFRIQESSLLFHEMVAFLAAKGFRLADIFDVSYRPCDGAFWQCDALFLRADHPFFSFETYLPPEPRPH